jgi:DNA-binding MarR family transcriptional regulator
LTKTKTDAHREVGQQLSFALYGAANRMTRLHKPFLEPLGLTFPQYLVMLELFNSSPRAVGELGTKLDMDTGTITPLLKRLEVSGMVTRVRDPADERRVLINLTDQAHALRDEVWRVTDKIETACQLTEERLAELRDTLNAFARPACNQAATQHQGDTP